jgi:hypothetical protein
MHRSPFVKQILKTRVVEPEPEVERKKKTVEITDKEKSLGRVVRIAMVQDQIKAQGGTLAKLREERRAKLAGRATHQIEHALDTDTRKSYFGANARSTFFDLYRKMDEERFKRQMGEKKVMDDGEDRQTPDHELHPLRMQIDNDLATVKSPRSTLIDQILEVGGTPIPLPIRPNMRTMDINLSGRMLGDERIIQFAKVLRTLPIISGLHIDGNNLTDRCVSRIYHACCFARHSPHCSFISLSTQLYQACAHQLTRANG